MLLWSSVEAKTLEEFLDLGGWKGDFHNDRAHGFLSLRWRTTAVSACPACSFRGKDALTVALRQLRIQPPFLWATVPLQQPCAWVITNWLPQSLLVNRCFPISLLKPHFQHVCPFFQWAHVLWSTASLKQLLSEPPLLSIIYLLPFLGATSFLSMTALDSAVEPLRLCATPHPAPCRVFSSAKRNILGFSWQYGGRWWLLKAEGWNKRIIMEGLIMIWWI